MFGVTPSPRAYPLQSSPFFSHLFAYDFLAAPWLIFSWLSRLHKIKKDIQHAMLGHLCNFQVILCIFDETINVLRSWIFECIHSPVCLTTTLPSLRMTENTPPFMITLLALWKNDALLSMMSTISFPSTKARKLKPFMDIRTIRLGMWMTPSVVQLTIVVDKVSVLVMSKYLPRYYLLPEMRLHRTNSKRQKSQFRGYCE